MRHTFFTVFLSWLLLSICSCPAFSWWEQGFTDSAEKPVTEYYFTAPGNEVYVRVWEQDGDETINAIVYVERPPANNVIEREIVILTEVPSGSAQYFGPAGGLPITFGTPTEGDGAVQGKVGDKLVFSYNDYDHWFEAVFLKKHPTASTAGFVDNTDATKSEYFIGAEDVWLRLTDDDQNEDPDAADTITATLLSDGGDNESLTLTETGVNTGIFRGSMASETDKITVGDGTLQVADNTLLTASYIDPDDASDSSSDTARFVSSSGIIVHKVTEPAGAPQSFNFILTGGPDNVSQSFALTHGTDPHNSGPIKPGTYNLSETSPPDGWERKSAVCDDGSAPREITLDYREVVTCTFINTKRTLTVAVIQKGSGRGTVTSNPAGIDCGDTCTTEFAGGSVVTLIANPKNGSIFTGWSDPCTGTASCIVHMPVEQTVSAEFYKFSWPMLMPAITDEKRVIK